MANAIQLHDDGEFDTIASSCVPIVFVPGVMGSRIDLPAEGLTWDPDYPLRRMAAWYSVFKDGKQTTRRALSVDRTAATVLTELSGDAQGAIRRNAALRAIGGAAIGGDHLDDDDLTRYYGEVRGWAGVPWSKYGLVLTRLEAALNPDPDNPRRPVYAFGYDWRQSNTDSGMELARFIGDVLGRHSSTARDVIVVTHSMGGLVLRGALAHDGFLDAKIRGVVHGAQPSNGAPPCYRRFLTGATPPVDGDDLPSSVINNIQGTTPQQYAYNLSGLPGPLQLLPNHVYQRYFDEGSWMEGLDGSVDLGDVYAIYRRPGVPGIAGVVAFAQEDCGTREERSTHAVTADFARHLQDAEGFHRTVCSVAHRNTYAVYSTNVNTDRAIRFDNLNGSITSVNPRPTGGGCAPTRAIGAPAGTRWAVSDDGAGLTDRWNDITYIRSPAGDGTVPAVSARCPALTLLEPARAVSGAQHADVYANAAFDAIVEECVRKLLALPCAR
ncbi:MAG TPA: hypothetical protein VE987_17330 [Polyangiaceae bacterium]|nr:hypothetical protein [Polyangiaceae bacterium]